MELAPNSTSPCLWIFRKRWSELLIPFETIAVILYLANISDQTSSPQDFRQALLPIILISGLCLLLVSLQTILLLKRDRLYSHRSRQLIWLCNSSNRILGCAATIFILHTYYSYNLFNLILPTYAGNYILQNITGMLIYIIITLCIWIPWYYIHRRTSPGSWTYHSYLIYKFRYTFFILGIWLPGILLNQYLESADSIISGTELGICSTLFFLLIAWIFPLFLRKFWGCTRLQNPQLQDKIQQLTKISGGKTQWHLPLESRRKICPQCRHGRFLPPISISLYKPWTTKSTKRGRSSRSRSSRAGAT